LEVVRFGKFKGQNKKLPVVLSQEEVAKILSAVSNIKHKVIVMLIYFASLRVGEIVKLKVEDIDRESKVNPDKSCKKNEG
jgi:integrase